MTQYENQHSRNLREAADYVESLKRENGRLRGELIIARRGQYTDRARALGESSYESGRRDGYESATRDAAEFVLGLIEGDEHGAFGGHAGTVLRQVAEAILIGEHRNANRP